MRGTFTCGHILRVPIRIRASWFGGVAQIPQDVKRPGAELLIAGIGPVVSLLLGGLFLALLLLFGAHHRTPATVMFTWLGLMNLSVGVFNLVPGFPMDGGRVFRAL